MKRHDMGHEERVALFTRQMVSVGASVEEIDAHLARVYGHACGSAHLPPIDAFDEQDWLRNGEMLRARVRPFTDEPLEATKVQEERAGKNPPPSGDSGR